MRKQKYVLNDRKIEIATKKLEKDRLRSSECLKCVSDCPVVFLLYFHVSNMNITKTI